MEQGKRTTPKERRKKEKSKSKLPCYNRHETQIVLGKMNQRLPFLIAIFLALVFRTLCFAESIQGIGSGEGSHYFEYNKSRSINARDYGLLPGSSMDQSSMLARAIKYASESKEIDSVYVPEGTYQFTQSIWLKAGVSFIGAGPGKTVFTGKNPKAFLIRAKRVDFGDAVIANMTISNLERALLITNSRNLNFQNVEFKGGMVRFEKSENITFEGNIFNDNLGKGGYAGSGCKNIRIVRNTFNSIENGSINLSGHQNSYVANNHITASKLIDSGYAGIRLPNGARNNVVENNFIQNHGRGLFMLSSSENNIVRNNTVRSTMYQGVLIQSSNNLLEKNTIIDAGMEAIYVTNASAENSPTPSVANGNRILENIIYDTQPFRASRCIGLKICSQKNLIKGNRVSMNHGRDFKSIRLDLGNQEVNNLYVKEAELAGARELGTHQKYKPEQPVVDWIKAVIAFDSALFPKVWSKEIYNEIDEHKPGAMDEFCKEFLALHAKLWVDEFPGAKDEDFTYSYAGYDTKGEVTISYKGKEVDPKLISTLPVVLENGSWKIAIVPGP